ncbi:MAG: phosphomannomutase/phosphoglucomutase [Planctomycetes bacterium]|nr:phosphomannomutase/phosphoglucomutase [Planctomycetota bacterium]
MGIFKAYDVRGKCPGEIDEAFATRLGRAYADFLGNAGTVGVGYDMRESSPGLAAALRAGLHAGGVDTLCIGMCTSPTLYYLVGKRGLSGGVMVTASHNPPSDNGFKICREQVIPVGSQSGLDEIQAKVEGPQPAPVAKPGSGSETNVLEEYLDHVTRLAGPVGGLKVAFDCGNGVAGPTLNALLARWPELEAVVLYDEPDGSFPNHPANPLVLQNLVDLQAAVKQHGCDLGVAFDGDGDRCVFVDDQGEVVLSDLITAFMAGPVLDQEPGAAIVYDLCSSQVVREEIVAHGGVPVEERVGHSFIKATMRAKNAPFAGENSGHYYFRDHWFADSALVATGKLLGLVSADGRPFSAQIAPLRRTFRSGERNFEVPDKDASLEQLVAAFSGAEVSRLDGVTIRTPNFWFNARKSNTEPLLRVNAESGSAEGLETGFAQITDLLGTPVAH